MLRMIFVLFFSCALYGAEITASVTVPGTKLADINASLTAYRQKLSVASRGSTLYATNQDLLDSALASFIRDVLKVSPTPAIAAERAKIGASGVAIEAEVLSVQPTSKPSSPPGTPGR